MKKLLLTSVLTFIAAITTSAQTWTPMSVGSAAQVICISFPDCDTGYASMDNNTLRKTVNGATTWTSCTMPAQPNIQIDFPTSQRGFMVCAHGISMTTDGAQTWNQLVTNNAVDFWDVTFVTSAIGYASALNASMDSAYVDKTINGGSTWTLLPVYGPNANIFEPRLYFYSPSLGFMNGDGVVYRTTDGGLTWNNVYNDPNGDMWLAMHSPDGTNFYEAGYYGNWNSSTNSGASWAQGVALSNPCYGIYFTSATHGFQCGGNGLSVGSVEETNNSGATWTPVYTGTTMWCMDFPTPACGYAAGMGGVIVKYDESAGVAENNVALIHVFPNPATDVLNIMNIHCGDVVSIHNALGQTVFSEVATRGEMQVDVALYERGMYIVEVVGEEYRSVVSAIVK